MTKDDALAFTYRERYPDANALFTAGPGAVEDILELAVFALDTSALLLPYSTGSTVLKDLEVTYRRLVQDGRLFIPGHVIREFLVNRDEKLKELHQQLLNKGSKKPERIDYAIFEGNLTYIELRAAQQRREEAQKEVSRHASDLARQVRDWMWNDPVSVLYREAFNASIIIEPPFVQKTALEQLQREINHRIPPGYKDASKGENSGGDSLVWQALLQIGRDKQCPLIFATGDTKSDWWIRSGDQPIHPRFELIHAYWQASGGHPLFMMPLADVLTLLNVTADTVQDIREAAYESAPALSQFSMDIPDEDVWLHHLHQTQVHVVFGDVQLLLNRTISLRLELQQGHPEFQDCIQLLTPAITFDWLPEGVTSASQSTYTGQPVTISAPSLPNESSMESRAMKSRWALIASLDGEDIASANFFIHLRLLRVEAKVIPSPIEFQTGGSVPFTLEVIVTPALDVPLPMSLLSIHAGDSIVEEVTMGATELVNGVLRTPGVLKFFDFESEHPLMAGPRTEHWIVGDGNVFGYRRPHYWTLGTTLDFVFPEDNNSTVPNT